MVAGDKVDLLFMIDNSASMGDKQSLLRSAIPDLLTRLVHPRCVDPNDASKVVGASQNGACAQGVLELRPVHDLHVGVVSSSLGGRGSDACSADSRNPTNNALNTHNDDQGHLLDRAGADEHSTPDAKPGSFLAWFPSVADNVGHPVPSNAIVDPQKLTQDFQDMVSGVHEYGCGFEAQLESWYRFLVQPDPYAQIARPSGASKATLVGVDTALLQQRRDFLRPDSALAVVMLTDENDSTVDPLALGGQGWAYENWNFPGSKSGGGAPRATSACASNPNDPGCTSCGFGITPNDASCQVNGGYYDPGTDDPLNLRFFHMKQRFGVDPQFPIKRYVNGLTSTKVPDRDGEHPSGAANYVGNNDCDNPIFARNLPTSGDLCHLTPGPRTPDKVFFTLIGGVPQALLRVDPNDPTSPQKVTLTSDDWVKVLGTDPMVYDFAKADPHMLESIAPRPTLPPPSAADDADPVHGREYDTKGMDLQYACTFALPAPKDCTDPQLVNACDCNASSTSPVCDATTRTTQTRGKAYPTLRELVVARMLGQQAVVSSICPVHSIEQGAGDPLFGYRPAFDALVTRMRGALQK